MSQLDANADGFLTPLQNGNGFSVTNSSNFADEISNIDIQDDEIMLSFDVVSLFTAIPVKKACEYIQNKLDCDESLHLRTNLDTRHHFFVELCPIQQLFRLQRQYL